ncbi:MAG: HAMP domain-containing protein, partial [Gemmatimonadetes bacterium]|nr:HAMP domain-containing protein [Gemmatimonadota bacterium]
AVAIVAPGGALLATSDSTLAGARVSRRGARGVSFDVSGDGELRRIVTDGATWLLGAASDTLAMLVRIPQAKAPDHLTVSVDSASRAFGAGFNQRLWFGAAAILLVAVAGATLLTRRLLEPLARLRTAAERVASGDYTARVGAAGFAELDPVARAFDGMAESLERSERSRRQLLRDVAHELRTPLTNLRAQVESLQDGLRPADEAAMASLHEEACLLERLVADVDVLARANAGSLEMRAGRLDLAELVRRGVAAFTSGARMAPSQLHVDARPVVVEGDALRLGQVLRNLVENAVQHGGPEVQVRVSCGAEGTGATLVVSDNGPGIPPQDVPHVFDHMYRADSSRARHTGGSGLGLAIVKAIVEAHGGRVELTSTLGVGTSVVVTLPAIEVATADR